MDLQSIPNPIINLTHNCVSRKDIYTFMTQSKTPRYIERRASYLPPFTYLKMPIIYQERYRYRNRREDD